MIFLRSEIQYYYCTISENSISEVFQRFKSEIFNFQFLFHEKSDFLSFCLTTFMIHNFLLVTEHLWKTPEMEFSDRVDIVLKKSHGIFLSFDKVRAHTLTFKFCLPPPYGCREIRKHGVVDRNSVKTQNMVKNGVFS